ncbi:hypothetical protein I4U23_016206 [Adineta vaga]|nr:hypothetical protein I4U23_016206 [Adineta vaga]
MKTIDNIRYDGNLYQSTTYGASLLYEKNGISLVIPLPNADLMSFVEPFDQITRCQNHVENNLRKIITLFAWDDNIQKWLSCVRSIPPNIHEIKIFCDSSNRQCINSWVRRYKNQLENVIFDIISWDKLNYNLMLFGVDHLKKLYTNFQPNSPEYRQLNLNYKRVCHALANYFWYEANSE